MLTGWYFRKSVVHQKVDLRRTFQYNWKYANFSTYACSPVRFAWSRKRPLQILIFKGLPLAENITSCDGFSQWSHPIYGIVCTIKFLRIAGFQSRDTISAWWSTPNRNTFIGSSSIFIISIDLVFGIKYMQFNEIYLLPQGIKRQYV
jgi:hypothetical protein